MTRNLLQRGGIAVIVAMLTTAGLPPLRAVAAETIQVSGRWKYNVPKGTVASDISKVPPGSMILNPDQRRGFQIFAIQGAKTLVRIIDLDTMKTIAETSWGLGVDQLCTDPFKTNFPMAIQGNHGTGYIHAVDPISNRFFLPYNDCSGRFRGLAIVSGETGELLGKFDRFEAHDPTAAVQPGAIPPTGSEDDDLPAVCTSAACTPQTFGIVPTIYGMEFVPSYISGSADKIQMMWVENIFLIDQNAYVLWLVQWDATTGVQDFSYRVQACGAKPPLGDYPPTFFQARLGGGIYIGCNASGGTGQVVRVRLNGNGVPDGEDSFPGPTGVRDVFADRETDRMIFRVSTPSGDSYWVFSGQNGSYSGISSATLAVGRSSTAVDPSTGRVYVMAPGSSRGTQSQRSGLLTTEARLAPTPQVIVHTDAYVPNVDLQLQVDYRHSSGTRIFAHQEGSSEYLLLTDPMPAVERDPFNDLDRLTTDVEEQEGVTDANFAGAGHAYGFRSLLANGVTGATPFVADVSGLTVRGTAAFLNSPCQTSDRELRLGSIPFANLSNVVSSAESAAGTADAGTVSDNREPSGRCHPHPFPDNFEEPPRFMPEDRDGEGTSDGDKLLGADWPFNLAQCSGDGEDEQVTTPKPFDRRLVRPELPEGEEAVADAERSVADTEAVDTDHLVQHQEVKPKKVGDIERDTRGTPMVLRDNRAKVTCALSEASVAAEAGATSAKISGLFPQIDSIEIGAVESFTRVYRDKDRGNVAETTAYVRNIRIGGVVFIDLAYSRAVAWAGGRPGTAGTSLDRRLCGVTIPATGGRYSVIPIDAGQGGQIPPDMEPVDVGTRVEGALKDVPNPDGGTGYNSPVGTVAPNYEDEDQQLTGSIAPCGDIASDLPPAAGTPLGARPFIELINRVLGSRGRAVIPEPDSALAQGSPGGYLASLQKDQMQQIGARSVSNDGTTQVPALEIQIFQDHPSSGRGRQLFQFAGVDASATYGIYLLNPIYDPIGTPGDDLPLTDITDDLFPITSRDFLPPVGGDQSTPSPSGPAPTGAFAPVVYLYRGMTFLSRSPLDAALAGTVLMILLAPMVLLGRRRALRTLP